MVPEKQSMKKDAAEDDGKSHCRVLSILLEIASPGVILT